MDAISVQPVDEATEPTTPSLLRGAVIGYGAIEPGRIGDDIALASSMGLRTLRFGVSWLLAEPKQGTLNGDVVELLRSVAEQCRSAGIAPWFTLLQTDVPRWFLNEGGFTDSRNAGHWWPRWVESIAGALGDVSAGWVPFEAPYAMANRLIPDDPRRHGELMDTLAVAWRDAWRILRGGPPVATSLDVKVVRPVDQTIPAEHEAKREDQLRWRLWMQGLHDGIVSIPGRADRELPDLAGACDVIGIAVRTDIETVLYRAAEMAPDRPLALTYRPLGDTDAQRAAAVEGMWRELRRAAAKLPLRNVSITPFHDATTPIGTTTDGIITRERDVKDTGHAFMA